MMNDALLWCFTMLLHRRFLGQLVSMMLLVHSAAIHARCSQSMVDSQDCQIYMDRPHMIRYIILYTHAPRVTPGVSSCSVGGGLWSLQVPCACGQA